ncbi:MAG: prepilin-type N-terminal cleavage/methylation domain-containing protein [Bacilli bacterium]|nr:prepilin-type N-terminal cleavage/methylation domain-containing protein [Bacilli bacterium]
MKKGFTLIELLAVIVILASVSMIVFPSVTALIKRSKENLYDAQVKDIELSSEKWALQNIDLLDKYHLNSIFLQLSVLKKEGFLENDNIKNPISGDYMNGCVEVKYNEATSQYVYKYNDATCATLTSNTELLADPHGYIRNYVDGELVITEVNPINPAGISIINIYQSNILYEGNTTQGLYDMDDEYVFRGNDPRNYAKFKDTNDLWRIISINKKDYTIKLMRVSLLASNQWDSNSLSNFATASINSEILNNFMESNETINKVINKIESQATFNVGVVSDNSVNIKILKSLEKANTVTSDVGLINISDYVLASTDENCFNGFKATTCATNNYLKNTFSATTWTINSNGPKIWNIDSSGNLNFSDSNSLYNIYPVIIGKSSMYVTNLDVDPLLIGTNTNPYILN